MHKTIIRRALILIPQLFVISIIMFVLAYNMPGDALTGRGEDPMVSPERIAQIREELGLNDPWLTQYGRWIVGIVTQLDFGYSILHSRPAIDVIGDRLPNTFWLALYTLVLIYAIAIPAGIIAGRYNDKLPDRIVSVYTFVSLAMPVIIFALLMLLIFGFRLQWFPIRGSVRIDAMPGTLDHFISRLYHMTLPAITAALLGTVGIVQMLRAQIVQHKTSDFVTTARSKGVPERIIYSRHILRNAFVPIAANIGFVIVALFAGAIFIETIFSFPGMGRLFIDSIVQRDFTTINAMVMLLAFMTAMGALLSDIILTVVDPRIRIR